MLSVTRQSNPRLATPGRNLVTTISVVNTGNVDLAGVKVYDSIPAEIAGSARAWTATEVGGASGSAMSGAGVIDETLALPVGATIVYTIVDTLRSDLPSGVSFRGRTEVQGPGQTDPTIYTGAEIAIVWDNARFQHFKRPT